MGESSYLAGARGWHILRPNARGEAHSQTNKHKTFSAEMPALVKRVSNELQFVNARSPAPSHRQGEKHRRYLFENQFSAPSRDLHFPLSYKLQFPNRRAKNSDFIKAV
jgi:hypothetical protein